MNSIWLTKVRLTDAFRMLHKHKSNLRAADGNGSELEALARRNHKSLSALTRRIHVSRAPIAQASTSFGVLTEWCARGSWRSAGSLLRRATTVVVGPTPSF